MSNFKKTAVGKTTSVIIGLTTTIWLSGAAALMPMTASAVTVEELNAQITALLAQIDTLKAQLATLQGAPTGLTFAVDLKLGSTGADVKNLQKALNSDSATQVAASGVGSSGNETEYFGSLTKTAVIKFQNKYAADILTPLGLTAGTGYVGAATRAKLNALYGGAAAAAPAAEAPAAAAVGTGLTLSAATQPAATIAPEGAARLAFTKVIFTAGTDGDVTVTGVNIERTGLAQDAVFAGIVLLDENGVQLGIEKTLNSDHKTVVGESFTVKAGQSKTMTIAGNMAATLDSYAGQIAYLSVTGAQTSATVTGTLPITGAGHTINATLTIGSVTTARGSLDPGSSQTKEIGITGYTFSSVRITAGSAEKIRIKSIRWNQSGSAATADLTNVKTYVDGVAYDTLISSDGKYYTSTLGDGVVVDKGANIELSVKGDIAGGSARTIDFDIYKRTDLYITGETYGYGITPPNGSSDPTDDTGAFSSTNPWYDAHQVTVSSGTMTVSSWTGVAAQNIAINLANQLLGGFSVVVKGESISVAQTIFNMQATGDEVENITNISLVDQNGTVIAGPVDGKSTGTDTPYGTVTFTDTITYPVGTTNITLKGKLGTAFVNGDTVQASTTPSTQWTTVTGQTTGNTITPSPSSALTGSQMTVRAGALSVTVSSQPTARTVIAGANQFEFARYIFDAGQSGENVRITSIPLYYSTSGNRNDLTNCQLYDGSTSITTGSNIKNPASTDTASSTSFTFDGTGLTLSTGTSKTLSLKCDLKTGTSGSIYWWGLDTLQAADFTGVTGLSSGQTITETLNEANGNLMTAAASGSYTVANDTSVAYKTAQAGATDVTLAALKFTANTSENIVLKQVALQLGNTASNSPADLVGQKASLWYGTTKLGEAQFGLSFADNATSTLSTTVTIPAGETVIITVKGDLSTHNANTNPTSTADSGGYGAFLAVTYDGDNNGLNGNYGNGSDSGATISGGTTSDVTTNGLRIFRSIPTVEDVTTTTSLVAGSDLYKVKITAGSGRDIGIRAMSFGVSGSGAGFSSGFKLYGPNGAVNSTAAATSSDGSGISGDRLRINFDNTATDRLIPAGTSKTYGLRVEGNITGLTTTGTESLSAYLISDAAYATSSAYLMHTVVQIESTSSTSDRFIWTPFSTTTPEATAASNSNLDWTNGYGMSGFPAVGQSMSVRVFKD